MSSILGQQCFLALAFAVTAGAASWSEPAATVQVWTYNYAGAAPENVSRAQRVASRILQQIGVVLEWVDCPRFEAERELFPRCRQDTHHKPVMLRIFSDKPHANLVSSPHVFGKAYLDEDGNGYLADVYTAGAELLADASPTERASMLGHLIAHELGHIFLASSAHSHKGIMRSHWSNADLRLALKGGLLFHSSQGRSIASNLRARAAEASRQAQRFVRSGM